MKRRILGVCFVLAGCTSVQVQLPEQTDLALHKPGVFLAGAARVDITPPPGYPMAGYSAIGEFARGHWLRLYARAIYMEDAEGRRLALVATDLWALPRGLHDRVAELLATDPELGARRRGPPLQPAQIVLAATHTHQGPGAYSPDRFFSAASGPAAGFDHAMFELIARRIAAAIVLAQANPTPALLHFASTQVGDVVRNRSFEAFQRDPEADEVMTANASLPLCDEPGYDPWACRAVDATMRMLRIDDAQTGALRAAAVFLAAHPTVIDHRSPLYSSDVFGAVALETERKLRGRGRGGAMPGTEPVVAIFNGPQGDVSFRWRRQDREELLRIGGKLLEPLDAFVSASLPARPAPGIEIARIESPSISSSLDLFSLAHRRVSTANGHRSRTARVPMAGRATLVGAEDGRTQFPTCVSDEGKTGLDFGAHGKKIGAFDLFEFGGFVVPPFWLTRLVSLILAPEREVAVSVHRIGPLAFATLPGEFTTVMGRRIRQAVAARAELRVQDVVAIGLAQSYAYYFATPQEYDAQHYEGSGTLWGREAGSYVAERLARLSPPAPVSLADDRVCSAADSARGRARRCRSRRYAAGFGRSFGPRRIEKRPDVLDASLAYVIGAASSTQPTNSVSALDESGTSAASPRLRWCWSEPVSGLTETTSSSRSVTPRVAIEVRVGENWRPLLRDGDPEDDAGLDFVSVAGKPRDGAMCWCSYWLAPGDVDANAEYRFSVTAALGELPCADPAVCSPGFVPAAGPLETRCPESRR